jgi:plastocyanin
MKRIFATGLSLLLSVVLPSETTAADTATVEGVVKLKPAGRSRPSSARYRGATGKAAQPDPPVAVVYLEGAKGVASDKTIEVAQEGMQFKPALLPVQVGTKVAFPNKDDFYHNVFSYSRTKRFDLGRFMKTENPPAIQFDQSGEVKVFCEIHRHMRGTILILDTPYFVKTDGQGAFKLSGLPAGKFKLKAWLDTKTVYEQDVDLKPGQSVTVDFPGQ